MNEDTKRKLLNFVFNIKRKHVVMFFFHIFFEIERDNPTHHNLFFNVRCKQRQFKNNYRIIIDKII
jgi:hypothetical protein